MNMWMLIHAINTMLISILGMLLSFWFYDPYYVMFFGLIAAWRIIDRFDWYAQMKFNEYIRRIINTI